MRADEVPESGQHLIDDVATIASLCARDAFALLRDAPLPIAILDEESRYVFVNSVTARMNGLPEDDHVGRTVFEVLPDVATWTSETIARMATTGRGSVDVVGTEREDVVLAHAFPFRSVDGRRLFAFVIGQDATADADGLWKQTLRYEEKIAQWSSRFLSCPAAELDGAVRETLGELGLIRGFASVAVLRVDVERSVAKTTHEWVRAGTNSMIERPDGMPLASVAGIVDDIVAGKTFLLRTAELPSSPGEVRETLERCGIVETAVLPLRTDGTVGGIVACYGDVPIALVEQGWRRLRTIADLIGSAIARRDAESARRDAFERLAASHRETSAERDYLREQIVEDSGSAELLGESAAMSALRAAVSSVGRTPTTVLVRGESGVGKELVARAIHRMSDRAGAPLVKVNCASIPRELFESEFFGHVRGAFTGASRDRVGRFELAHRGTIFLDEVGEIPLSEQSKLLRVLQEQEFERVGDDRTRRVDVRVVAATNRDLERDVEAGRFRRDLYYRLSVFPIDVPPLRSRGDDVRLLAEHFARLHARRAGKPLRPISRESLAELARYDFPGNVRELSNLIERAVIVSDGGALTVRLARPIRRPPSVAPSARISSIPGPPARIVSRVAPPPDSLDALRELEERMIRDALAASSGRVSGPGGAAERLGIKPSTLRDRIKRLAIRLDR